MLTAHLESVWQAVAPVLPGFTVELLPTIDSTNSELMRRVRAGLNEPVLLVAQEQTAGRGRLGKPWSSPPGHSLAFSLGLPLAPLDWSGLSLVVGVSLAESLHPDLRLKWPNDLWLEGRKAGGILVETASSGEAPGAPRMVIVGVGLNIARPPASVLSTAGALPPVQPAGLSECRMGLTDGEALEAVAAPLVNDLLAFASLGFGAFAARFDARDALRDRELLLSDGTTGTGQGVGPDGSLRVMTAQGLREISSAEVSVRPC